MRDATRVFLGEHGLDWYARQGLEMAVLEEIELLALTVNPLAPQSHRFDSAELRARLAEAIPACRSSTSCTPSIGAPAGAGPTARTAGLAVPSRSRLLPRWRSTRR